MSEDRKRSAHARYRVVLYDFNWHELPGCPRDYSANDLIVFMEEWNRKCQREARNNLVVIADETLPIHVGVEVLFV